jgi:hypothetical protein
MEPNTRAAVAVKLIHPAAAVVDEINRSAFLHSLEIARSGAFPALPRTLDFGLTDEDSAFLVTEWMELATPLGSLSGEPPARLVPILHQLVNAIDGLAVAGVAHLNLSLDNVLVTVDDSVRVVGFGTAAYLVGSRSRAWPGAEDRFVAPEAFRRDVLRRDKVYRADLFSLALMSCELLGAEIRAFEDSEPELRLPPAVLADNGLAEEVFAASLRRDPEAREFSLSELRQVLVCGGLDAKSEEGPLPTGAPPGFETIKIELPEAPVASPGCPADVDLPEDFEATPPEQQQSGESGGDAAPIDLIPVDDDSSRKRPVRFPWRKAATIAAAVFLLFVVVGMVKSRPRRPPRPQLAMATPPATKVAEPIEPAEEGFGPETHLGLEAAEQMLLDGDARGARDAIAALSEEEVEHLSAADREQLDRLVDSLDRVGRDRALTDLAGGLDHGSIRMLRRAVAALDELSDAEIDSRPELRSQLQRAQAALKVHQQLWDANRAEEHLLVIERAGELIELLPEYSASYEMRIEAAAVLESAAEHTISRGDFEAAIGQLEEIRRRWPERAGLEERVALCRNRIETEGRMHSVLEAAASAGTRGDPEEGLRVLAAAAPTIEFAGRFDAMRSQLENQLSTLDGEPPVIVLPEGFKLRYRKGTTIEVPITVTDDYRVERVVVALGTGGAHGFEETELSSDGNGSYTIEIGPDRHRNGKVFFFVAAEDRSGHRSQLGDASDPIILERKKWYKR